MDRRKDEIRKELKELSPGLQRLPDKDGFEVPHNYFKQLPDQIMARVEEEQEKAKVNWISVVDDWFATLLHRRYALALATALGLVVVATVLWPGSASTPAVVEITADDAYQYALANLSEFEQAIQSTDGLLEDMEINFLDAADPSELDEMLDEMLDELDGVDLETLL